jgi:succinate dehydrogenase / fumarate reductase cytochrome b subunit
MAIGKRTAAASISDRNRFCNPFHSRRQLSIGVLTMPQNARPLSPHLQIYRWPLAMAVSILHRTTGVALAVGTLLLLWVLLSLSAGPQAYAEARALCGSPVGLVLLFGWSWALCFHLVNGIRHLFWDMGKGYSIQQAKMSGIVVVVVSLILAGLIWACVFAQGGA